MKPIKATLAAIFVLVAFQTSYVSAQPRHPWVTAASYSPDGSLIAIVGELQDFSGLFVFDIAGREQARFDMPKANGVAWGPDGRLAVRWWPEDEFHHVISILDAQTWEETVRFGADVFLNAFEILWSPDGQMLLNYSETDYQVRNTADGKRVSENFHITISSIQDAFWHPVTQEIYILDAANRILVFDPITGSQTREPIVLEIQPGGTEPFYQYASQIEISSDGSQIAIAFNDGRQTMQVIDTDTGETTHLFNAPEPEYRILGLRWITDGQLIATQTTVDEIEFWNVETGDLQQSLSVADHGIPAVTAFVFHPDRTQIAIIGADMSEIWGEEPPQASAPAIGLFPATAVLLNLD